MGESVRARNALTDSNIPLPEGKHALEEVDGDIKSHDELVDAYEDMNERYKNSGCFSGRWKVAHDLFTGR